MKLQSIEGIEALNNYEVKNEIEKMAINVLTRVALDANDGIYETPKVSREEIQDLAVVVKRIMDEIGIES